MHGLNMVECQGFKYTSYNSFFFSTRWMKEVYIAANLACKRIL